MRAMLMCAMLVGMGVASLVSIDAVAANRKANDEWATVFDGKDLKGWQNARDPKAENKWSIEDGAMTNAEHGNDIATIETWKDFELKIEFKTVAGGNSGVYLRGRIEIQVLDSFGVKKPGTGDNGAIYDQFAPKVNASKPVGEWNTIEARLVGDELSVTLNGQVVQDKIKLKSVTGGAMPGGLLDPGPLMLQGDHGKVWYRNIQIKSIE